MQAAETVYEFGSSPDEDEDNAGQTSVSDAQNSKTRLPPGQHNISHQQQPTSIAGSNLRPNKTSSTSINQKLNTSFSSISDSHTPNPKKTNSSTQLHHHNTSVSSGGGINDISNSGKLLLKAETKLASTSGGGSANFVGGSVGNTSNTSLSSTTNSSRGNISQSGNQSIGASSQKSVGHQQSSSSSQQQNPNFDSNVISERVKNLATQIYQELKRIISRCNYDEDILSGLMPLIVRVLESLDLALIENQQLQVELELCKDDNDQLVIMFEKEKAAKRTIDKKLIESEYAYEEERQQYQQKIESLDNIVKMFELKAKNASDQATRFEEKEAERKREYNKLHDRYTELLKSHCDVVERVRHLVGNSEAANLSSINVPQQMVASSSELTVGDLQTHPLNKLKLKHDEADFPDKGAASKTREILKSWNAETELTLEDASLVVIDDLVSEQHGKTGDGSSHNESERAASEIEGEHEKESENDSIAYTSMEKEFRKLIQENKDLLNTKNALNVVKDDLIAEVDRLTNEVSMYEQAVEQLNSTKDQMKQKVSALDAELRRTKEELEKAKQKVRENNEEGVPYSQRKRFGRAEMAKVLMERNNYKERFMELQDAVRYTELVRANRMETEKRSGLWKFFSNLFGAPPPPTRAIMGSPRNSSPVIAYNNSPAAAAAASVDQQSGTGGSGGNSGQVVAADVLQAGTTGSIRSTAQRLTNNSDLIVLMDSDLNIDRSRASRENGGGRLSLDMSGYIHAYGWSLRASSVKGLAQDSSLVQTSSKYPTSIMGGTSSHVASDSLSMSLGEQQGNVSFGSNKFATLQVPIPQYCRPLTGDSLGMKIWCATAIDLSGGDLSKTRQQQQGQVSRFDGAGQEASVGCSQPPAANSSLDSNDPGNSSGSLVNISTSSPVKLSNQQALRQLEHEVSQALSAETIDDNLRAPRRPILKATTEMVLNTLPYVEDMEELSTCVWICSTQHSRSKITIIDIKTKPNELLDSFYIPTFLYTIKSIPGCKPGDLLGISAKSSKDADKPETSTTFTQSKTLLMIEELISNQRDEIYKLIEVDSKSTRRPAGSRVDPRSGGDSSVQESSNAPVEQQEEENTLEALQQVGVNQATGGTNVSGTSGGGGMNAANKSSATAEDDAEISRILDNDVSDGIATLQKLNDFVAHSQLGQETRGKEVTSLCKDNQRTQKQVTPSKSENRDAGDCMGAVYYQPISTHLSTVWMGGKDSVLYIHSAIGQWKDCVACVELRDSILQVRHYRGRVFVALADGSLCVFFRDIETKQWQLSKYLLIDINLLAEMTGDTDVSLQQARGSPLSDTSRVVEPRSVIEVGLLDSSTNLPTNQQQPLSSTPTRVTKMTRRTKSAAIHCLEIANKNLWVAYRNRVLIMDPITLKLKHTFNVVPQVDNQVRQLVSMRDGVFICLRSDLTLRLYSSLRPYQHIQNIDIEPVVTRLISPKTFVISHITAMRVVENTLWIGIAHGIILTIPCLLVPQISEAPPVRNSATGELEELPSHLSIARFVPKCDINNAQISFHGHRDAVKFFVHAHNLMLSGGQGYLDFRLDMDDQSKAISDKSHLILWQLPA